MARPTRDLARATSYYRDLLGLRPQGGFDDHDGYDGVFFALPGGGELELTASHVEPTAGTEEDLLVFYVRTSDEVRAIGAGLAAAGVRAVAAANPYWNRWGQTFLDPDGYLDLGRVLVAVCGTATVGHLQLVPAARSGEIELKNMAVVPRLRGTGVGRALVHSAVLGCAAEGWSRLVVATAAADTGNLRFYQRLGFRFLSVDRDVFTAATGYPDVVIDGIPLLDRVWLSRDLHPRQPDAQAPPP